MCFQVPFLHDNTRYTRTYYFPVGVDVSVDVKVMDNPPEADVILLRREGDTWTNEQLQYLPDGIRDVSAQHVLIEFKYSELLNKNNPLADDLTLILLNKLPPEEYNAFVKLFASRKKEQKVALSMLNKGVIKKVSFREDVIDLGERLMRCYVENLPIEERLAGLQPEERLAGLQPEEVLRLYEPEEMLRLYEPEE
ncbi:MAG: hypothetical protein B6242_13280, partial [Anaerolineaceae bacterium 4572_78]